MDPLEKQPTGAAGNAPRRVAPPPAGPLRSYRPVMVARLSLRLEDFSNEDGERAESEREPAKSPRVKAQAELESARANLAVARASGDVGPDDLKRVAVAERKLSTKNASRSVGPPENAPADIFSVSLAVVPLEASLELNSFRIADKLQMSVALKDLPIIPEMVRALLIDYYEGLATAEEHGDPARWVPRLLEQPPSFRGYVDQHDMEAKDEDGSIQFQARSLESVLMDAEINPRTKERAIRRNDSFVDGNGKTVRGEKLTKFLRRFISTIPEFSGQLGGDAFGVRIWPNFDPSHEPILGADMFNHSLQTAQSRAQAAGQVQGAPPVAPGQDPSVDPGLGTPAIRPPIVGAGTKAWDVVVRAAELCGFLPVYDPSVVGTDANGETFRGSDNILLVLPQTLMESPQGGITIPGGAPDAFERQFLEGGVRQLRSQVRFMVWGHNVSDLKFGRKFGRTKAPAVRVVCADPDAPAGARTLVSIYPSKKRGTRASSTGTGRGGAGKGHAPTEELITKVVHGIRRQADLDRIAVALYHTVSRQEVTCEITTGDLQSYVDPAFPDSVPDLLTLRPGTPVRVSVAEQVEDPAKGLQVNDLSQVFSRRANPAFLRKALLEEQTRRLGLSDVGRERLAAALERVEEAYARARLTDWFYTRVINRKISEDGWEMTMELVNYVEARSLPANLSPEDKAAADLDKLIKPTIPQDLRASTLEQNFDDLVTRLQKEQT